MENRNIKFNYRYRDGGNYKLFNSVIFMNPNSMELDEIQKKIEENLIDGDYFVPGEWKVPILEFEIKILDLDHHWHEFESVEKTDETPEEGKTIDEFLELISTLEQKFYY